MASASMERNTITKYIKELHDKIDIFDIAITNYSFDIDIKEQFK